MTELKNYLQTNGEQIFIRLGLCIVIIVLTLVLKNLVSKVIFNVIRKHCKNKAEAIVTGIIAVIDAPLRLFLITTGFYLCRLVLRLPTTLDEIYGQILESLLLYVVFWLLYNAAGCLRDVMLRVAEKTNTRMDNLAATYLCNAIKIVVVILGALSIIQLWVGNISGLIAGLSIGGVAVALAAQDTAANIFGSITVMLDHPFELGDFIEVGSNVGTVEKMGLRSTKIRMPDQAIIFVPNSLLSKEPIINRTKLDRRRMNFDIGLTYTTTPEQMEEFIKRVKAYLEQQADIREEGLYVAFHQFSPSSLDVTVRFFTEMADLGEANFVKQRVNLEIMRIVSTMGLSFAFPSQSVYVQK